MTRGHLRVFGEILGEVPGSVYSRGHLLKVDDVAAGELAPSLGQPAFRDFRSFKQYVSVRPASFGAFPYEEVLDGVIRKEPPPAFDELANRFRSYVKRLIGRLGREV